MYKHVTSLYNQLLAIYFKEDNNIIGEKKEEIEEKYDPSNLLLEGFKYDRWY